MVERHLRAHRLDRQGVRLDLHRRPQGHGRGRSPASRRSTSSDDTASTRAGVRRVAARQGAGAPGRRAAEGGVDGDAHADRQGRQGDRLRRRAEPRLLASTRRGRAFNPLDARRGHVARAERGRDRHSRRRRRSTSASATTIGVQAEGPVEQAADLRARQVRLASISIGGATLAGFDLPTAQRLFEQARASSTRSRSPRSRASRRRAARRPDPRDPAAGHRRCARGDAQAREDAKDTNEFITFLQGFLLAFGGIALFVGAFVIANSLSITIAQRTRELATLRTLGASRRQVLRSIVLEALVDRHARLDRRALPRARPREGPVQALRRGRVHAAEQRPRLRDADGHRLARRRDPRHAARQPPARDPRDARAADRGRARGRDAAAGSRSRASARVGSRSLTALGFAALALRAVRQRASGRRRCSSGWASARCWSSSASRCSPPGSSGRSPASLGWPATRLGGAAGHARARQRAAQPAAHRLDRRGADDRARARHARRDARGRDHRDASAAPSTRSATPTTRSRRRTTSRRSRSRRPKRPRRRPGSRRSASVRTGEARVFGEPHFATAVDPAAAGCHHARLEGRLAADARRRSAPTARSSTTASRRITT